MNFITIKALELERPLILLRKLAIALHKETVLYKEQETNLKRKFYEIFGKSER